MPIYFTTTLYITDINIVTWRSTGWELHDDGLCKPKHVGATIIIWNDFNNLTILYELFALVEQIKNLIVSICTVQLRESAVLYASTNVS